MSSLTRTWRVDPRKIICPWCGFHLHSYSAKGAASVPEDFKMRCPSCKGTFQLDESRVKN